MTVAFLPALNKIFEQGILSREHVASSDSPVSKQMSEGFLFFSSWCADVIENGQ